MEAARVSTDGTPRPIRFARVVRAFRCARRAYVPIGWARTGAALALLAVGGLSAPARALDPAAGGGSTAPRGGVGGPSRVDVDDERRARIEAITVEISELGAQDLAERAAALRNGASERAVLSALILRAGRPLPPGLSAGRRTQREARAREALDWLARELENDAPTVDQAIAEALEPAPGRMFLPDLAAAAMSVAADLDRRAHAPAIARVLERRVPADLRARAQFALYRLFGRRFPGAAEFDALWPELAGLSAAAIGRPALHAASERADDLFVRLVELDPRSPAGSPFERHSPRTAARVATALSRAVASGTLAPADALDLLGDGLAAEVRALPFHARLQALLDLVQGADATAAPAQRVEEILHGLCASSVALAPDRAWIVIAGLPRLVYPPGAAGDAARAASLAHGVAVFQRTLVREDRRPLDPDGMQTTIGALIDLAGSIEDKGLRATAARPLVEIFERLVTTPEPLALGIRRAAASGLRLSLRPEDAAMLLDMVQGLGSSEVEYELIGALRSAIAVLEPGSATADQLIERLFTVTADSDFDARQRAIAVLAADDVAPALAALDPGVRRTRALYIIERLRAIEDQETSAGFLVIFGRVATEDTLERLLDDPDRVTTIAKAGAQASAALGDVVRQLAGTDGPRLLRASSQILGAASGVTQDQRELSRAVRRSIRLALLRLGLGLALEAGGRGVAFAPADHARLLRAAVELLRVEAALGRSAALSPEELARLMREHVLPLGAAPGDSDSYALERELGRALVGARLLQRGASDPPSVESVLVAFDAALTTLGAGWDVEQIGWDRLGVELEAIRLVKSQRGPAAALARFDAVLDARDADPAAADSPLPVGASREYVQLLVDASSADDAAPGEARVLRAAALLASILDPRAGASDLSAASPLGTWLRALLAEEGGEPRAARLRSALASTAPERTRELRDALRGIDAGERGSDAPAETSRRGG